MVSHWDHGVGSRHGPNLACFALKRTFFPFVGGILCFRSSPRKRTWKRTPLHQKAPTAAVPGAEGMSWWRQPHRRLCWDSYKVLSAKTHPQSNHQRSLQVQSSTSLMKISMKPWKSWTSLPSLKTLRTVYITTTLMFSITRNLISTETTGCSRLWWTFWGKKIDIRVWSWVGNIHASSFPLDFCLCLKWLFLPLVLMLIISFGGTFAFASQTRHVKGTSSGWKSHFLNWSWLLQNPSSLRAQVKCCVLFGATVHFAYGPHTALECLLEPSLFISQKKRHRLD